MITFELFLRLLYQTPQHRSGFHLQQRQLVHHLLAQLPEKLHAYQRHTECVAWMRKHHANPDAWLALDDRSYIFYPFCPNLVVCNARTGLDGQTLDLLATRLATM